MHGPIVWSVGAHHVCMYICMFTHGVLILPQLLGVTSLVGYHKPVFYSMLNEDSMGINGIR